MSSVLPLAASLLVASTERLLLSVGRNTGEDSSGLASRPAGATQAVQRDVPLPGDPAVIVGDAVNELAPAANRTPTVSLVTYSAAATSEAHDAQFGSPAANAAAAAILPLLAGDTIVAPSQAAYRYAQMMQVWLESKSPRSVAARPTPKSKAREKR
ncbi:MAG TPA: hypothetical protein VIJ04_02635 [Xanthobacteraceae bacterium]